MQCTDSPATAIAAVTTAPAPTSPSTTSAPTHTNVASNPLVTGPSVTITSIFSATTNATTTGTTISTTTSNDYNAPDTSTTADTFATIVPTSCGPFAFSKQDDIAVQPIDAVVGRYKEEDRNKNGALRKFALSRYLCQLLVAKTDNLESTNLEVFDPLQKLAPYLCEAEPI
nr:unnamed protein product [Spirometra erinaceieuropaei]